MSIVILKRRGWRASTSAQGAPPGPPPDATNYDTVGSRANVTSALFGTNTPYNPTVEPGASGTGWTYSAATGILTISGDDVTFDGAVEGGLIPEYVNVTGARAIVKHIKARWVNVSTSLSYADRPTITWSNVYDKDGVRHPSLTTGTETGSQRVVTGGPAKFGRCELGGVKDIFNVNGYGGEMYECWIHDPCQLDPDPGQGGDDSHEDVFQVVNGNKLSGSDRSGAIVVQDCRIDWWLFNYGTEQGAVYDFDTSILTPGDGWGNVAGGKQACTSVFGMRSKGTGYSIDDVTLKDLLIDGNYFTLFDIAKHPTAAPGDPEPTNITIRDIEIKQRHPNYGINNLAKFDGDASYITWCGVTDLDTAAAINPEDFNAAHNGYTVCV